VVIHLLVDAPVVFSDFLRMSVLHEGSFRRRAYTQRSSASSTKCINGHRNEQLGAVSELRRTAATVAPSILIGVVSNSLFSPRVYQEPCNYK